MKKQINWVTTYSQIDVKKAHQDKPLFQEYLAKRKELISKEPILDHSKWDGMTTEAINYRANHNAKWRIIQDQLQKLNIEYWPKMVETFNIKPPLSSVERNELDFQKNQRKELKEQKKLAKLKKETDAILKASETEIKEEPESGVWYCCSPGGVY